MTHSAIIKSRLLAVLSVLGFAGLLSADFDSETSEASAAFRSIHEKLNQMVAQGNLAEANQMVLDTFPEATRTPAQAFVIANVLYGMDVKLSYALHKEVAEKHPNEPYVLLEWGMQQHRAGEHAGALAAYDSFSKLSPDYAPVHGLATDCLIRLGKTREAAARWKKSEEAGSGTMENFESLVCAVYQGPSPNVRRAELRKKAADGDADAAVQLIALSGEFEVDWWNKPPNPEYLKLDVELLQKLTANPRIKAAICAAECRMEVEPKAETIKAILLRHGYLIDSAQTLPTDGALLSMMLGAAMETELLTPEVVREKFGKQLREMGKSSKDPALWNVLANIYSGTDDMLEIEEQAWAATGDEKFAVGYLTERIRLGTAKPGDAMLAKALGQFPESANIAALAASIGVPLDEATLVQFIKAEFRKFSIFKDVMLRPRARQLRAYFVELARVLEKQKI
jgi:tetratricopeptide (TPR) repeat protein